MSYYRIDQIEKLKMKQIGSRVAFPSAHMCEAECLIYCLMHPLFSAKKEEAIRNYDMKK